MFTKQQAGLTLVSLLCLGLAAADYFGHKPPDTQVVWLVFAAIVPWALPWLSTLFKSVKVGGMELDFRDLEAKIQETQEATRALASGIGVHQAGAPGPPSSPKTDGFQGKSLGTAEAGDFDGPEPDPPVLNPPVVGARRLSATVKPFLGSEELFMVHAWVNSTDIARPLAEGTPVTFHLPAFNPTVVVVRASGGLAAIDRVARGPFTIGAEVDGVRLALPLNTVAGAPERFKSL
jgi:hypothetical protein